MSMRAVKEKKGIGLISFLHAVLSIFHHISDILCAGTNLGSVAMWKYEESKLGEDEYMKDPEKDWKLQNPTVISGTVKQVS